MVRTFAVLAILACAGTAFADPVLDQSYMPVPTDSLASINTAVNWSQTFTVGATGTLTSIDLFIAQDNGANGNLFIDIRTTSGGAPTDPDSGSNILGTATIGLGTLGNSLSYVPVDVTDFAVTANDVLAIVLRSSSSANPYVWGATGADGYAGGAARFRVFGGAWSTSASFGDLAFKTYVDSPQIPEPTTLALLAAGLGVVIWRRRR